MGIINMAQRTATSHTLIPGRLQLFLPNWKRITADPWVINCIQGYSIDLIQEPFQHQAPKELVFSQEEMDHLTTEVEKMVKKQAIRLDGKGRPEGCIFHGSSSNQSETPATVSVGGNNIPVQLSSLWTVVGPLGLYQDHKANSDSLGLRMIIHIVHRRHPDHGRLRNHGKGTHGSTDISPRKSRLHSQFPEVSPGTNTRNNPGFCCQLNRHGNQNAWGEN